jgi:hypothetical protein
MQMDVSQIGQWFGRPSGVRDEMVLVMTILYVYMLSEPPMVKQRRKLLFGDMPTRARPRRRGLLFVPARQPQTK